MANTERYIRQGSETNCGAYTLAYWYYGNSCCTKTPKVTTSNSTVDVVGEKMQVNLLYDFLKCSGALYNKTPDKKNPATYNMYKNYTNPISIMLFLASVGENPVFYLGLSQIKYSKKDDTKQRKLVGNNPIFELYDLLKNHSENCFKKIVETLKTIYIQSEAFNLQKIKVGDAFIAFCFEDCDEPTVENMHYILILNKGQGKLDDFYAINPWSGIETKINYPVIDSLGNYQIITDNSLDKSQGTCTVYCFGAGIHIPS